MRFWDTSAVVPLLVAEVLSPLSEKVLRSDREMAAWWCTSVECASALARRERESALTPEAVTAALALLDELESSWIVINPVPPLALTARRLLRTHVLCAADALQLAAALVLCESRPQDLPFVCLDEQLRRAAHREGFALVPDRL